MKKTFFDIYHPAVQVAFFASLIVFTMVSLQPAYIIVSLVAAVLYNAYLRGWRATAKTLSWQLPLFFLIVIMNAVFTRQGSTLLFQSAEFSVLGVEYSFALYLESAIFGACMGAMLVSMMLWFSNAAQVLSTDKVMSLFGNTLPTITLMMAMTSRLMPKLVEQGREIRIVQKACTTTNAPTGETLIRSAEIKANDTEGAGQITEAKKEAKSSARFAKHKNSKAGNWLSSKKTSLAQSARVSTVLMGRSMEDSFEMSQAMRARGFASKIKRSTYLRYRFRTRDAIALICIIGLTALNAVLLMIALPQFHFYPNLSKLIFWWGYIPYAILMFLPLAGQLRNDLKWIK